MTFYTDPLHGELSSWNLGFGPYGGMHVEMLNRSLFNRNALDWLDEVLGQK